MKYIHKNAWLSFIITSFILFDSKKLKNIFNKNFRTNMRMVVFW